MERVGKKLKYPNLVTIQFSKFKTKKKIIRKCHSNEKQLFLIYESIIFVSNLNKYFFYSFTYITFQFKNVFNLRKKSLNKILN